MTLAKHSKIVHISIKIRIESLKHTDESLLTPETHMSWVIRLPAMMIYGPENVGDEIDRLPKPCLMSGTKNVNIGKDRKC